jgi:manganese efflux pump family protein
VLVLLLVAVSLGLSNFGAAIGIGVGGVDARTRMRIGIIFGLFEAGMPIVGLALGHGLASVLGQAAHWIGGALLVATGAYSLLQVIRDRRHQHGQSPTQGQSTGRLLIIGAALSIDNLAVGFALGTYHVDLIAAAILIGAVSVGLTLIGLELGDRLGARTGPRGELLGGVVLIAVGIVVGTGML